MRTQLINRNNNTHYAKRHKKIKAQNHAPDFSYYKNKDKKNKKGRGNIAVDKTHRNRTNSSLTDYDYANLITNYTTTQLSNAAYNILALYAFDYLNQRNPGLITQMCKVLDYTYINHLNYDDKQRFFSARHDTSLILDSVLASTPVSERIEENHAPDFLKNENEQLKNENSYLLNLIDEQQQKIEQLQDTHIDYSNYIDIDTHNALQDAYDDANREVSVYVDRYNEAQETINGLKSGAEFYRAECERLADDFKKMQKKYEDELSHSRKNILAMSDDAIQQMRDNHKQQDINAAIAQSVYYLYQSQTTKEYIMLPILNAQKVDKINKSGKLVSCYEITVLIDKVRAKTKKIVVETNTLHKRIIDYNCIPLSLDAVVEIGNNIKNGYVLKKCDTQSARVYNSDLSDVFAHGGRKLIDYAMMQGYQQHKIDAIKYYYKAIHNN